MTGSFRKHFQISCLTYNHTSDSEIDLSSLIGTKVNYLAEVKETLKSKEGPPVLVSVIRRCHFVR